MRNGTYPLLFTDRVYNISIKPLSFIKSITVQSLSFRQIINKYGTNVSPCKTPATMLKKSVSPSGE